MSSKWGYERENLGFYGYSFGHLFNIMYSKTNDD